VPTTRISEGDVLQLEVEVRKDDGVAGAAAEGATLPLALQPLNTLLLPRSTATAPFLTHL
jgi:hypothetical protein